jgi:hypothetical protein
VAKANSRKKVWLKPNCVYYQMRKHYDGLNYNVTAETTVYLDDKDVYPDDPDAEHCMTDYGTPNIWLRSKTELYEELSATTFVYDDTPAYEKLIKCKRSVRLSNLINIAGCTVDRDPRSPYANKK